ncbi:MAG: hypothetical protein R3C56_08335 [Pirellulaceae bacterium]
MLLASGLFPCKRSKKRYRGADHSMTPAPREADDSLYDYYAP